MPAQFVEQVFCVRSAMRCSALALEGGQLPSKMDTTPLTPLQRIQKRRQLTAGRDRGGQVRDLAVDPRQLVAERWLGAGQDIGARLERLHRLREGRLEHLDAQDVMLDCLEHGRFGGVKRHLERVGAHRLPALLAHHAAPEARPAPAV